jgi:hypothetical protein
MQPIPYLTSAKTAVTISSQIFFNLVHLYDEIKTALG